MDNETEMSIEELLGNAYSYVPADAVGGDAMADPNVILPPPTYVCTLHTYALWPFFGCVKNTG